MAKTISYLRVSTDHQDFERQAPATIGTFATYVDKFTGKTTEGREGLKAALDCLEKGDTLVVWEMWRLGRSVVDVRNICEELQVKGVNVNFKSEGLYLSADTESPMAKAMNNMILTIMAACGEFDRAYKVITIQQGVKVAKKNGVKFGASNPKHKETFQRNKEAGLHKSTRNHEASKQKMIPVVSVIKDCISMGKNTLTLDEISNILNEKNLTTSTGKAFTKTSVSRIIKQNNIERKRLNKHVTQGE